MKKFIIQKTIPPVSLSFGKSWARGDKGPGTCPGVPGPGEARCGRPAPSPGLPCASRHHGLGPGRHDLLEAALVEESTLPGSLQSCGQKAKAGAEGLGW